MMFTYKLAPDVMGQKNYVVIRSDGAFIPMVNDNTDYQAYLKWLEAGNTPEAAS